MLMLDDLEGGMVGNLMVIARAADTRRGSTRYFTRCKCGTEQIVLRSLLVCKRPRRSCGCRFGKGMRDRVWTPAEDAFIRLHYATRGASIADEINRTENAVRTRAGKLGLHCQGSRERKNSWTAAEDAILREHYPRGGTGVCLPLLPGRSKSALRNRACDLGIYCGLKNKLGNWTERENQIMRENYSERGWRVVQALIPNRSRDAILVHAQALGLKQTPRWTPEEENLLKTLYPKYGRRLVKKLLSHHSDASVRGKIAHMGLRRER